MTLTHAQSCDVQLKKSSFLEINSKQLLMNDSNNRLFHPLELSSFTNIANITHQLLTDCNLTILYIKYILNMFTSVL